MKDISRYGRDDHSRSVQKANNQAHDTSTTSLQKPSQNLKGASDLSVGRNTHSSSHNKFRLDLSRIHANSNVQNLQKIDATKITKIKRRPNAAYSLRHGDCMSLDAMRGRISRPGRHRTLEEPSGIVFPEEQLKLCHPRLHGILWRRFCN